MLGWGHNSRGVETRHCRPHPQTRQTEEGARQLQTHLPDIPPRESVYERITKNRLEYHCESKKVFPVCQAGFRRGRDVTDHLVKLGEHVGRAIGRRKVLLTCFFDISRAYDQVWHAKLLQKLNKIGISGNMYNYIRSFLSDRSMQVRWKGATSTTKGVSMGVPQGSVIAPLLFNIMVHDVDTAVKGKVVLTMYADDLAIWTDTHIRRLHINSSWVKQSMKLFQEAVDGVVHFMQVNGFALSSQKTVFVPFHTNTSQNTEVHIRVNGQSIFASKEVKYLGVHFTRWGRTNQQVAHNARNASRTLNVIKVLSAQPWANTPKILVNVVRALVRSRLLYGLEAMPHLSKTGLARLTAIEVRGPRLALGLPQSVPQCLVYKEAGLLPFRRHIQLVCSKYVFRCQTVDNSTVDEITATFRTPPDSSLTPPSVTWSATWSGARDWMVLRWRRGRCIPIHLGSWNERTLRWTWKG